MAEFTASVAASEDDAQESAGTMALSASVLNANATTQSSGMRFTDVTIPPGSAITAATLDLYLVTGSYDDPDVTIRGEDTDDAAAFSETDDDITGRDTTAASVTWTASNVGTGTRTTPDFAAVVQEIVDRPGWASGNALVVLIAGNSSSSALRWASFDSANPPAELNVTYTPPGGVAAKAMHLRRGLGAGG